MSDGQTHGERLEAWAVGDAFRHRGRDLPHRLVGRDGDMWIVEWGDSPRDRGRISHEVLTTWCEKVGRAPDRAAMLREAYALAKGALDYNAMAKIASQL